MKRSSAHLPRDLAWRMFMPSFFIEYLALLPGPFGFAQGRLRPGLHGFCLLWGNKKRGLLRGRVPFCLYLYFIKLEGVKWTWNGIYIWNGSYGLGGNGG